MQVEILKKADVKYLDRFLLDRGLVRPVHYEILEQIPRDHFRIWCVKNGVYQMPTCELIAWLQQEINGRSAIEICAGRSCLGRYLGIHMVDNYMHCLPEMNFMYSMLGQQPTQPLDDVERLDANKAVLKYQPQAV